LEKEVLHQSKIYNYLEEIEIEFSKKNNTNINPEYEFKAFLA